MRNGYGYTNILIESFLYARPNLYNWSGRREMDAQMFCSYFASDAYKSCPLLSFTHHITCSRDWSKSRRLSTNWYHRETVSDEFRFWLKPHHAHFQLVSFYGWATLTLTLTLTLTIPSRKSSKTAKTVMISMVVSNCPPCVEKQEVSISLWVASAPTILRNRQCSKKLSWTAPETRIASTLHGQSA